ncbi:type I DNA topoisomerase [Candidatus Sumerlaeota bacterium]|nr:type I DNA topoisomerase [Candidatus Sumerlaeota bacterium]
MAKSLVVVESPAKARTISKYLGKDYQVLATMGHIRDLPTNRLGVDLEHAFAPEYIQVKGKEKALAALRKAAKSAERVFLASDFDREGEAIAWHVSEELRLPQKKAWRVTFNEVTKEAILRALENPGHLNMALIDAQQARRILDRIVGYQLSPLLWEKIRRGLSAGRVQSVAVRLVVEREQEIQRFQAQEYWTIEAEGMGDEPPAFAMRLVAVGEEQILQRPEPETRRRKKGEPAKRLIADEAEAKALVKEIGRGALTVASVTQKRAKRNPAPPFITSTLQQEAHRKLRFSPKKTMVIAQRLYEGVDLGEGNNVGLITYMRTDSTRIADIALTHLRHHIEERHGKEYLPKKPNVYRTKKGAQDAHEAIRPTYMRHDPESVAKHLTPDQLKLYTLIWNRTVACQMAPARVLQTRIELENPKGHRFAATGTVIEFPGFLAVYEEGKDDADNGEVPGRLPALAEGAQVTVRSIEPVQHFTQPPPRFTGASLVKELESRGIGRPSTYAAIVSVIQEKEYVSLDKGRFKPTELGVLVTDLLVESFPEILDAKFTALMEEQLDQVEDGKVNWVELLRNFYDSFRRRMAEAKVNMRNLKRETIATDITCDKCGRPMVVKWGRNGRFLACSGYPECRNTRECDDNGDGSGRSAPQEAKGQTCPNCGKTLIVKSGRRGRFAACPGYPECKHSEPLKIGVKCPREGCPGEIVERQSKKGRTFWACNAYPDCDHTSWEMPAPEPCPECKHPYLVHGKGPLRGRLKCPACGYKKPSEIGGPSEEEES